MSLKVVSGLLSAVGIFAAASGAMGAGAPDVKAGDCRPGGEGPKPVANITNIFPSNVHRIPTNGEPTEFLSWEKKNQIAYRSDGREIIATSPDGGFKQFLSTSSKPLARVVDAEERFLVTANDNWFLDTWAGPAWVHFRAPFEKPHHLFWYQRRLYSMRNTYDNGGGQRIMLYRYNAGASSAHQICPLLKFTAGEGYQIGEGHSYPYVVLYRVRRTTQGNSLTVALLNVSTCGLEPKTYARPVDGDVENVHWFRPLNSYLVKIDSPTKQLMWDTGPDDEHCHYYNVGKDYPAFILGYSQPVVGLFNPNDGLSLLYLHDLENHDPKTAQILNDFPLQSLGASDVWLTKDGSTLYAAPTMIDQSRWMLKIDLPETPTAH